jgi:DNA invertase Pin-like site-specific DNA recombinase
MKITPDHLARGASIYIRQSTADQLANNHESRRRQYDLADRARALGWTDVTVIDDDLGRSGSGVSRPGCSRRFARAASAPCSPSRRRAWRATGATGTR